MKTVDTLIDNEEWRGAILVSGAKRSNWTSLVIQRHYHREGKTTCAEPLAPTAVRALRRVLAQREAELVEAGHLAVEE
jgi:hypothetical protein